MSDGRERRAVVLSRIWDDPDWLERSRNGQWMYLLLMSQANLDRSGVIALTVKRWSRKAKDASVEAVLSGLEELEQHRFVVVDHDTEEVLVRSYMRNDGVVKVPNVFKAALRRALEAQSPRIREALAAELRRVGGEAALKVADALSKGSGKGSANPSAMGSSKGSGRGPSQDLGNPSSGTVPEGLPEGLGEGLPEPHVYPRGEGEGLGSCLSVGTNSLSSREDERDVAPRSPRSARRDEDFDRFWTAYPRRVGKGAAVKAWAKALKQADAEEIIKGAGAYAKAVAGKDQQYTAHPGTWLNQMRWLDEDAPSSPPVAPQGDVLGFQVPTPPIEILEAQDPSVRVQWLKAQRDAWLAKQQGSAA